MTQKSCNLNAVMVYISTVSYFERVGQPTLSLMYTKYTYDEEGIYG